MAALFVEAPGQIPYCLRRRWRVLDIGCGTGLLVDYQHRWIDRKQDICYPIETKSSGTRGRSPLELVDYGGQLPVPLKFEHPWVGLRGLYYKLLGGTWSYKAYDQDPCKGITWGRGLTKPGDHRI